MKFLCHHCKSKYQIADEKVAGRTLKMKCRKCGHDIIIRGDEGASSKPAAPPPSAPPRKAAAGPPPAPKPAAAPK
ncbi:MAG: zinc-ribbon domain-containing protein, partial [Myxococcota bacterium]